MMTKAITEIRTTPHLAVTRTRAEAVAVDTAAATTINTRTNTLLRDTVLNPMEWVTTDKV